METVTKFLAVDGREFNSETRCREWEACLAVAHDIESELGPRPRISHGKYVQRDVELVNRVKNRCLDAMRKKHPSWSWNTARNEDIGTGSIIGRYADDSDSPFRKLWCRLMCISMKTGREYDQPFFAFNEHESTGNQ